MNFDWDTSNLDEVYKSYRVFKHFSHEFEFKERSFSDSGVIDETVRNLILQIANEESKKVHQQLPAGGSKFFDVNKMAAPCQVSSTKNLEAPAAMDLPRVELPCFAEFIAGLLTKKRYREALLQSLEEDFNRDVSAGMSVRRAKLRYWASALHCALDQIWPALKRVAIAFFFEAARRLIG